MILSSSSPESEIVSSSSKLLKNPPACTSAAGVPPRDFNSANCVFSEEISFFNPERSSTICRRRSLLSVRGVAILSMSDFASSSKLSGTTLCVCAEERAPSSGATERS